MPLLKLKQRLGTVKNLNSIFSALQVVTVVRTKRIREKYAGINRYLVPMREVLQGRLDAKKLDRKILVVITSNRGLCGSFNSALIARALSHYRENPGMELAAIGKFGIDSLKQKGISPLISDTDAVEKPSAVQTAQVWQRIMGTKSEIYIAYNAYKSTILQQPTVVKLYPVPEELAGSASADYLLEPDKATLVR